MPRKTTAELVAAGFPEDFLHFWDAYPRKQNKTDALKAWLQMEKFLPTIDELCVAINIQSQSEQWQKSGGMYVPMPATWLRGMRWEDEIEVSLPKGSQPKEAQLPSWMRDGKDF